MKIQVVRNVLEANEKLADQIRVRTNKSKTLLINIMSSPGSGKTTLLEKLIPILQKRGLKVGVIEGDITTTRDSERILPLGISVSQINTEPFGGDCHLGSEVIMPALDNFDLDELNVIFIENVGNLVCPAEFDTGADYNMVVLSTTEGEDKPLKYPLMFRVCHLAIVNKIDLLPYLDVDISRIESYIRQINPTIYINNISAKSGEGISEIADWISERLKK
ncbi:MAG: hydrogenase nickel incorporation protein HypB [Candidatus Marinimicrobia bacterium]|nr:hydrogenase nickel incorporation protein HypB [Candidatus Neomarinimicrobiota bacterium]